MKYNVMVHDIKLKLHGMEYLYRIQHFYDMHGFAMITSIWNIDHL